MKLNDYPIIGDWSAYEIEDIREGIRIEEELVALARDTTSKIANLIIFSIKHKAKEYSKEIELKLLNLANEL